MNEFELARAQYARSTGCGSLVLAAVMSGMLLIGCVFAVLVVVSGFGGWLLVFDLPRYALMDDLYGTSTRYLFPAFAVLGLIGVPLADRIVPPLLGAHKARPDVESEARIRATFETVALAAGVDPIVYVIDAEWLNVASLGRRGSRPVVVTSLATARLSEPDRQVVAAMGLTDALMGGRSARLWFGFRMPIIVVYGVLRRAWPALIVLFVGQHVALWRIGSSDSAYEIFSQVIVVVLFGGGTVLWLAMVAVVTHAFAGAFRVNADIAAIALLRHPEQWHNALLGFRRWEPTIMNFQLMSANWLIPVEEDEYRIRFETAVKRLPAVGFSLASKHLDDDIGGLPPQSGYR